MEHLIESIIGSAALTLLYACDRFVAPDLDVAPSRFRGSEPHGMRSSPSPDPAR